MNKNLWWIRGWEQEQGQGQKSGPIDSVKNKYKSVSATTNVSSDQEWGEWGKK